VLSLSNMQLLLPLSPGALFVHYAIIIFTVSSKPLYKFYSTIDSTVRTNICNFHDSDVAEDDGDTKPEILFTNVYDHR
jgi:hypothetical protein